MSKPQSVAALDPLDPGEDLPAVPDGYTRVESHASLGRGPSPLIAHNRNNIVRLQWCPLCGHMDSGGKSDRDAWIDPDHYLHEHYPSELGLSPCTTLDLFEDTGFVPAVQSLE